MSHRLIDGVLEFQRTVFPEMQTRFEVLADGQQPHAAFVTCSDSRIDPYLLTSSEPGDLFVIRTAGNIVPPKGNAASGESATLEYAVRVLKVGSIVVCGHARCGAMDALTRPETVQELSEVRAWIEHSGTTRFEIAGAGPFPSGEARIEAAAKSNVLLQLEHLKSYDFVRGAMTDGGLILMGWYYDFVTGRVETYNADRNQFVELRRNVAAGT